jgi:hypothetical protein
VLLGVMDVRFWVFQVVLLCWLGKHGIAWRYGCGVFSSLCSPVERCDISTFRCRSSFCNGVDVRA